MPAIFWRVQSHDSNFRHLRNPAHLFWLLVHDVRSVHAPVLSVTAAQKPCLHLFIKNTFLSAVLTER